jgi:hypothetical protein
VPDKPRPFKSREMTICQNPPGGKNSHPMSYSPQTGLVYIPSINLYMDMEGAEPAYKRGSFYLAFEFALGKSGPGGYMSELMAWDPVKQQKVWGNKDALPWLGRRPRRSSMRSPQFFRCLSVSWRGSAVRFS